MNSVDICRLELNGHHESPEGSLSSFSTLSLLSYLSHPSYLSILSSVNSLAVHNQNFCFALPPKSSGCGFVSSLSAVYAVDVPLSNSAVNSELFHRCRTSVQPCAGFDFEEGLQVLCANSWRQISMNMHHKLHALTFVVGLDTPPPQPHVFNFPKGVPFFFVWVFF